MKNLKLLALILSIWQITFAGGIVTNTNQSASYIRMLARDASTDVDAVFYNPAGLIRLTDGFYIQLNSQMISQERTITSTNKMLNNGTYEGSVFVPVLPSAFGVYKTGDWAFSGGFTIIGGGGSASFNSGLPAFESDIALLSKSLESVFNKEPITSKGYSVDISFDGSSIYMGSQAGVTYSINDIISIYAGARYVNINNSYNGSINDISFNVNGASIKGSTAFRNMFDVALVPKQQELNGAATSLESFIPTAGEYTFDQLLAAGQLPQGDYDKLTGGLSSIGVKNPGSVTVSEAQATFAGTADKLGELMEAGDNLENKKVDVKQTGSGITPIIGTNISLMEGNINIGVKYEMKTKMTIENNTTVDDTGTFPDKIKTASDMPAFLSVGVDYKVVPDFKVSVGLHYYWDKDADYGKNGHEVDGTYKRGDNRDFIENNSYELAIGLQYDINDKVGVSGGYLHGYTNPNNMYQSDLSYSLKSNTFSLGAIGHISDSFDIDFGILYTLYDEYEEQFDNKYGKYSETYDKSNFVASVGITYRFGANAK